MGEGTETEMEHSIQKGLPGTCIALIGLQQSSVLQWEVRSDYWTRRYRQITSLSGSIRLCQTILHCLLMEIR